MNLETLIELLNQDLSREYSHWHFYIQAAANVEGLHRKEFYEFFKKEAEGEMEHVLAFARLLVGLGIVPDTKPASFVSFLKTPAELLKEAIKMETEVVNNYSQRMEQCDQLQTDFPEHAATAKYIHVFVEDQLKDSRKDADEMKQMLKGI